MRKLRFRAWNPKRGYPRGMLYSDRVGLDLFFSNILHEGVEPMQYADLKDKNGKEICQGDRLKYEVKGFPVRTAVVEVSPGRFTFYWENEKDGESHTIPLFPYSASCWEIIGSIHENLELVGSLEARDAEVS